MAELRQRYQRIVIDTAPVLGLAETMWSTVFAIEYRDPAVFVALVVLLALRPEGLWRG